MDKKLVKLFCGIKCEPDREAAENIWHAIVERDRRIARVKFWSFCALGFVSLLALMPALSIMWSDLSQSGFFDYFSLLSPGSSLDGSVFSYWRELSFSLIESLPTMSILLSLSLVFSLFLSLKYASGQIYKKNLLAPSF
jgi:hypothetical protein